MRKLKPRFDKNRNGINDLDLSDSISKRNVAQKRQEPSLIGRWERRAQPYLGKFTKPAMAFAFVYKEKDTIDKDRKRSDYLAQSSVDAANQKDSMESKRGKSSKATNVFIAQTLSARLKKKSLALQDEKRIFSYLEQWMDSKYLRIRDAFKRIDTDGSGELDMSFKTCVPLWDYFIPIRVAMDF